MSCLLSLSLPLSDFDMFLCLVAYLLFFGRVVMIPFVDVVHIYIYVQLHSPAYIPAHLPKYHGCM